MDWVFDNLATNKVKLVNLSIGTTAMYAGGEAAACDRAHPAMASAIKNLIDAGVSVFAATGNRGSTTSMPAPACNTGVIAVGAVYDSNVGKQPPANVGTTYAARWGAAFANCSDANGQFDQITCFTNSTARMDLVAPGAPILSDSLRGRTELYWGTSQAAPAAVGVAALLLECDPTLTPAQIKQTLQSTGVQRTDMRNGVNVPSLRALAAVKAVCDENPPTPGDAGAAGLDAAVADGGAREAGVGPSLPEAGMMPGAALGGGASDAAMVNRDAGVGPLPGAGGVGVMDASTSPVVIGDASVGAGAGASDTDCDCAVVGGAGRDNRAGAWLAALGCSVLWARRRRRAFTQPEA
jgi:hypothetical protein